jgi:hypothetical protein
MAEEKPEDDAGEIVRRKVNEGAMSVLEPILSDPGVQRLIRRTIVREAFKSGLFLSFLIVGLMMLFGVAQSVWSINWVGSLVLSVILIVVGLAYLLKESMLG